MNAKPIVVLVDDNKADLELNRLTLMHTYSELDIRQFLSGSQALEYLTQESIGGAWPSLMVLDLKMPGMNGFEVLERIMEQQLKRFPIVVLSSSCLEEDKVRALQLGADKFVEKPIGLNENIEMFRRVGNTYLNFVEKPL
ncbi:response regulator [Pontibacter sp. G13]|uniref:response regulator n=1 Tax=Pontibacter sp. G13 TaxID=3074898 RepID=UPI002889EDD9|nr:response regulator [Pontibacter sp. G13]WNJ21104.1 response regulator [Pontibacter sp. G13]